MSITSLYQHYLDHPIISTDTRKIVPGCIFFALRGDHFDGNEFAHQAIEEGAAFAVVDNPVLQGEQFIHVPDTLRALQELASLHRRRLSIPVLGITGTNGKTTTKELIARVLGQQYRVHATQGNLNNHIGVPLTMLSIPAHTEIVVCEMGANHVGEIALLCQIAQPTHGLITNIGRAHLEGFGSFEGVIKAKSELYQYIAQHQGTIFINVDDPSLSPWRSALPHTVTYGLRDDVAADHHFVYVPDHNGHGFSIRDRHSDVEISSAMFGHYNAINALAAYSVGRFFDVAPGLIANAITGYIPGNNRSQVLTSNDCTIVKDAYNANPSSMELAIKAFDAQFPNSIMILGDMKELGSTSFHAHQQMIALAAATSAQKIYLVGPEFKKAIGANPDDRMLLADSIDQLKLQWNWANCKGGAILLKGSRSMRLEALLND